MKTILAYGDSLTWGSIPGKGQRHPYYARWPNVLAIGLGDDVEMICDGLRGRTTAYDEHLSDSDRNGARTLPTALYAHAPLDLVILMLGSNDLKPHIAGTAIAAMQGMRRLATIVQNHVAGPEMAAPKVLIVSPPAICKSEDAFYKDMLSGAVTQSKKLPALYSQVAEETQSSFFDAGKVAKTSPTDGIHLDEQNTINIGNALIPIVKNILN